MSAREMPRVAAVDVGRPVAVRRPHVGTAEADEGARDLDPGHRLGLLGRALERAHRRVDVDDVAPQRAAVGRPADADDLEGPFPLDLRAAGDQHADLGRAHVDGDHVRIRLRHPSSSSLARKGLELRLRRPRRGPRPAPPSTGRSGP